MPRVRDSQRAKLYRSEKAHSAWIGTWVRDSQKMTLIECQVFVDKLVGSAWFRRRWPLDDSPLITDGRGGRSARAGGWRIAMPRWARSKLVLCHELAHIVVEVTMGYHRAAPHGWQFADVYLQLIRHTIGADAETEMKRLFRENHVRWTEKRTRQMTEEQKQALRDRLAQYREQKVASGS